MTYSWHAQYLSFALLFWRIWTREFKVEFFMYNWVHPPKSTKITTKASQFEYVYARKNNIATRIDGLRCLNVCGQTLDHRKPPSFD